MIEDPKPFDRVRIGNDLRIYVIQEVDPPGATPLPPSTHVVIIAPEAGGIEQRYGNHRLNKLDP